VRQIDAVLDLSWVHAELAPRYPSIGRPSIDPELMIRMLIVGYVFAIRSERALCREVKVNLAYRWFCKLGIEDQIPDHSAFSRARNERFKESDIFRRVFERVVSACIGAGLVGGQGFAVDASLIVADANKQRSIPGKDWDKQRDPGTASRAVKEYLATLDDAAFGAASDVTPKFVSPSDPAAQWTGAMRGPAFFVYADNYLIDVKFGIIMDVEATRAIRQAEVGAARTMIDRTEERFGLKPERLAGDTAYGSAPTLNWLVNEKGIAPQIPVIDKSKREDGTFSREDFTFSKEGNVYICPAFKLLTTTGKIMNDDMLFYRASTRDCAACAFKMRCCPKEPSRKILRSIHEEARDVARAIAKTEAFSNRAATANASRCCLLTRSASCDLAVCGCAGRVEPSPNSRWHPSPRTCAGLASSSPDRRPRLPCVLREHRVALIAIAGIRLPAEQNIDARFFQWRVNLPGQRIARSAE
jgi:transposase